MSLKLPFDATKPIVGEASIEINRPPETVFNFIADNLLENYPKWAPEVIELEPINTSTVTVGTQVKQVRDDNGNRVESIFEVQEYAPHIKFIFQGINAPYKHSYLIENDSDNQSRLTFKFELLDIEVFMRPFQKLIRVAIEDGAENTVDNIKQLLCSD